MHIISYAIWLAHMKCSRFKLLLLVYYITIVKLLCCELIYKFDICIFFYLFHRFCCSAFHQYQLIHDNFCSLTTAFDELMLTVKLTIKEDRIFSVNHAALWIYIVDVMRKTQSLSMTIWKFYGFFALLLIRDQSVNSGQYFTHCHLQS